MEKYTIEKVNTHRSHCWNHEITDSIAGDRSSHQAHGTPQLQVTTFKLQIKGL